MADKALDIGKVKSRGACWLQSPADEVCVAAELRPRGAAGRGRGFNTRFSPFYGELFLPLQTCPCGSPTGGKRLEKWYYAFLAMRASGGFPFQSYSLLPGAKPRR